MGTLSNRFQYIWYGTCEVDEDCKPYVFANELTALKVSVDMISTFSTTNSNNSIEFFKPETEEGTLKQLVCGAMYCITLKEGKSISISHATPAGSDSIKSGENEASHKVSFTCASVSEATPTPTEFVCIPDNFTSIQVTSQLLNVLLDGQTQRFVNFETGNVVGVDPAYWTEEGAPPGLTVNVTTPSLGLESQIVLTGHEPKADGGKLYLQRDTACYAGPYEFANGEWKVELVLVSGEEATPTPEPEPTPTPDEVDCTCAPSNFATNTISGQVHDTDHGVRLIGFISETQVSYDVSTLISEGLSSTVTLKLPNNQQAGQLILTSFAPNNTQFYVKHGAVCYTATATSSNGTGDSWELTMVVSKTLSSECGDTGPLPTPTPEPDPTPTPEPEPDPTPTPQPPSECCPSSHTQADTVGGTDLQEVFHTYSSGMQVAILKYQGYNSGGTLCADLTLTDGWTEEGTESTKLVLLPGSSDPIGTIAKTLKNGSGKSLFYYNDPDGNCFRGDYDDASPIQLTSI
jgi:hypothetical protein